MQGDKKETQNELTPQDLAKKSTRSISASASDSMIALGGSGDASEFESFSVVPSLSIVQNLEVVQESAKDSKAQPPMAQPPRMKTMNQNSFFSKRAAYDDSTRVFADLDEDYQK